MLFELEDLDLGIDLYTAKNGMSNYFLSLVKKDEDDDHGQSGYAIEDEGSAAVCFSFHHCIDDLLTHDVDFNEADFEWNQNPAQWKINLLDDTPDSESSYSNPETQEAGLVTEIIEPIQPLGGARDHSSMQTNAPTSSNTSFDLDEFEKQFDFGELDDLKEVQFDFQEFEFDQPGDSPIDETNISFNFEDQTTIGQATETTPILHSVETPAINMPQSALPTEAQPKAENEESGLELLAKLGDSQNSRNDSHVCSHHPPTSHPLDLTCHRNE